MNHIIERQREIVARHIRGENEHDWAAVYDTFVQDDRAHYDVVPLGTRFNGIEGVRGFYQAMQQRCLTCISRLYPSSTFPAVPSAKSSLQALTRASSRV